MWLNRSLLIPLILILTTKAVLIAGQNSSDDLTNRIKEIQSTLDAGEGSAKLWWYGWAGFYTGAAVFSFGLAGLTEDKTLKITQSVAGVESLLGAGGLLIFPFPSRNAAQKLRRMPESTNEERIAKLKEAERLLKKSADAELSGRSWLQHTLAFLVNTTGSLVIWKGYEKQIKENGDNPFTQALINFALGTAVAELQIWTQPTKAIKDRDEYQNKYSLSVLPTAGGMLASAEIRF